MWKPCRALARIIFKPEATVIDCLYVDQVARSEFEDHGIIVPTISFVTNQNSRFKKSDRTATFWPSQCPKPLSENAHDRNH